MIADLSLENQVYLEKTLNEYLPEAYTDYDTAHSLAVYYLYIFEDPETAFEGYRWYHYTLKLIDEQLDGSQAPHIQLAAERTRDKIYHELLVFETELMHGKYQDMLKVWLEHAWVSYEMRQCLKLDSPVSQRAEGDKDE